MEVFLCHMDTTAKMAILSGTSLKYHQTAFSYQAE